MEEGIEKNESTEKKERQEIFSRAVRAGKRTYFFDVKATRKDDYYLTITESKKRYNRDGKYFYEKHKVFLYKEDFDKFLEGLTSSIDFIKENNPETHKTEEIPDENTSEDYTSVEFEDLGEQSSGKSNNES
ncbi:MAG: DUF3276 family protein [Bacteroidota bacterium]